MTQPVWITPVGSLGTIQESIVYRNAVVATDSDPITYRIIAGTLPTGIQFLSNGSLTGIPSPVGRDVISRFTVRATTTSIPARIADRTFSITVTGSNTPHPLPVLADFTPPTKLICKLYGSTMIPTM